MGKRALNSGMYKIMTENRQYFKSTYIIFFLRHSFQIIKNE